jgi:hypothetical protein
VAQIFSIVREIRRLDASYQFCHVAAHKIGERVVAEDPDKWVDAIPLNPSDGLCSNGFIHGVVGGRFRAEVLDDATIEKFLPDFTAACAPRSDWQPSRLDRAICYHGMGHLFDFITDANLDQALSLCSRVAPPEYTRVCTQGVFMQIYQPLEPDDYALIARMPEKPTADTVLRFCASFAADPVAQGSCIEESWPLQRSSITDGTGVERLCAGEPNDEERDVCYISMSSIIGRMTLGAPERAAAACRQLPEDRVATCFSYSAEAVLEEDRADAAQAVALCKLGEASVADQCLSLLTNHADFIFGSANAQREAFCNAVPESLQQRCNAPR